MSPLQSILFTFAQQDTSASDAAAGAAGAAVGGGIIMVQLIIQIAFYLFFGFCMMKIAQKLGDENAWWSFIPILNLVQIVKLSGKEMWWVILCFIPCVNIVVLCIMFGAIAEKLGKPAIVGYLTPFVGIFTLPYMAFAA